MANNEEERGEERVLDLDEIPSDGKTLEDTQDALLKKCHDILVKYVFEEPALDSVAVLLTKVLSRYLWGDVVDKYFDFWQEHGFHLTRVHHYSPIPDTRDLTDDLWERESELVGIDLNLDFQLHLLRNVFPRFREEYDQFPHHATEDPYEFHFDNTMFSGTDALVLYCMIRYFQSDLIVEVGSGHSTRVSAKGALRNSDTKLICIEPYASDAVRNLPGVIMLVARRVQDIPVDFFEELEEGDILFIDSSHTVKCGGDVNYLYLEVIPRLKRGVIVHVHDIFFPKECPESWIQDLHLFWNEQYLLQAFLTFNSAFEILFSNSYMGLKYPEEMKSVFPNAPWWDRGGSLWMRRKA